MSYIEYKTKDKRTIKVELNSPIFDTYDKKVLGIKDIGTIETQCDDLFTSFGIENYTITFYDFGHNLTKILLANKGITSAKLIITIYENNIILFKGQYDPLQLDIDYLKREVTLGFTPFLARLKDMQLDNDVSGFRTYRDRPNNELYISLKDVIDNMITVLNINPFYSFVPSDDTYGILFNSTINLNTEIHYSPIPSVMKHKHITTGEEVLFAISDFQKDITSYADVLKKALSWLGLAIIFRNNQLEIIDLDYYGIHTVLNKKDSLEYNISQKGIQYEKIKFLDLDGNEMRISEGEAYDIEVSGTNAHYGISSIGRDYATENRTTSIKLPSYIYTYEEEGQKYCPISIKHYAPSTVTSTSIYDKGLYSNITNNTPKHLMIAIQAKLNSKIKMLYDDNNGTASYCDLFQVKVKYSGHHQSLFYLLDSMLLLAENVQYSIKENTTEITGIIVHTSL